MSEPRMLDPEEGKLLRDIDFQILMRKEKIRDYQKSIEKIKRMSGMNGPSGMSSVDYSGLPRAKFSHANFPNALASIAKIEEHMEREKERTRELIRRKRKLIEAAERLEGTEQLVFVYRVLYKMTQEEAASTIGISTRQLQRVEQKMKEETYLFEI